MTNTMHKYFLFATGIKNFKEKTLETRKDAEAYMQKICSENGIRVECTEDDKHYKKYSNHAGVRFYINRI